VPLTGIVISSEALKDWISRRKQRIVVDWYGGAFTVWIGHCPSLWDARWRVTMRIRKWEGIELCNIEELTD
jgi:hypothetical protein